MTSVKPKFDPDPPEPDTFTKTVRAVCGALLGLLIGFEISEYFRPFGPAGSLAVYAVTVAGSAMLAVRYGDEFWREVADGFRWP